MGRKTCLNCGSSFPLSIRIDGKRKTLASRLYCLTCSPYGAKNRRRLEALLPKDRKRCPRCGAEKSIADFYKRRDGEPSPYCKPCTNQQTTERTQALKAAAVAYKGGRCQVCGYDRYIGALDFHHRDRTQKGFGIGGKRTVSLETIKAELDKCVLLCATCHREAEAGLIDLHAIDTGVGPITPPPLT